MTLCVLIDRHTPWGRIAAILKGTAETLVVAVEEPAAAAAGLAAAGQPWRPLHAYGPTELEVNARVVRWLRGWSNRPAFDGLTVKELLLDGDRSLWWLIDIWLLRTIYLPPLHRLVHRCEQLASLLDLERPQRIVSLCRGPDVNRCLAIVAASRGVAWIQPAWRQPLRRRLWKAHALAALGLLRIVPRRGGTLLQGLRHRRALAGRSPGPRIVYFTVDTWQRVFDETREAAVPGDGYAHNILQDLMRDHTVACIVNLHPRRMMVTGLREKLTGYPRMAWTPLEGYADMQAVRQAWAAFRRTRAVRRRLVGGFAAWPYNGLDLSPLIEERLRLLFAFSLPEALLALAAADRAVARERPVAIFSMGDHDRGGKAVALAALRARVPYMVALHGLLTTENPYVQLTEEDAALGARIPACRFPFPHRLAVYTPYDRDRLVRGGFPPETVEVVGDPRWTFIAHVRERLDRAAVCGGEGLDPNAPIIVFTTQTLYDSKEEEALVAAVCATVASVPRAQLILKLHPSQTDADERRYREVVRRLDFERVTFRRGRNLYDLLFVADALVTVASTTALEALVMDRPVVIVDLYDRGYRQAHYGHPAILGATTEEELHRSLRAVLADQETRSGLAAARADFLRLAWGGAGSPSRRIVGLLRDLMGERTPGQAPWAMENTDARPG